MAESFIHNVVNGIAKKLKGKKSAYKTIGLSWLELRVLKNMPDDEYNTVSLFGKKLFVFGRIGFLDALNEIFISEFYKIALPKKAEIIDCGANVGLSIIYMKNLYPDAHITAFEPDTKNFSLLEKNVQSFGLDNVVLIQEAAWIANTELSFSNEGTMSSKISDEGKVKIKARRLRELINKKVDFLKIDIEGAEYAVMKDLDGVLHNVNHLFLEYHGNFEQNKELIEILSIISKSGFSFYIKEAANVYAQPFFDVRHKRSTIYDVQLNIFCFKI